MKEFIHRKTGEEMMTAPWSCTVVEEGTLTCKGRQFLFVVGDALVGSSCVGVGTLRYIQVPGFVALWRFRVDDNGDPVSAVDPVTDDELRDAIQQALTEKFPGLQVCF
ncbi:MAG: hypothetical protein KA369_10050 [Spirochaetes bacterium]|nr:hypothetical protein [Spirochaetota bacterium]